jgi:hypothetical protein
MRAPVSPWVTCESASPDLSRNQDLITMPRLQRITAVDVFRKARPISSTNFWPASVRSDAPSSVIMTKSNDVPANFAGSVISNSNRLFSYSSVSK